MPTLNPAYLDALYRTVNASPFPRHLPFRLVSLSLDGARIELDIAECHLQPFGIVHGGVIATLIDTATFWAGFGSIPEDAGLVNVDLKLNYLQSVASGRLVAVGRAIRSGRTISYTEATITTADGVLVAHGTSTLMVLPGKGLPTSVPKFVP
ncbi:MAG: PaaI family thioesterase [Gemmatimonadales bacterium]|nr:PaaI family thioesterase [Gemmatimonadales bacterium]